MKMLINGNSKSLREYLAKYPIFSDHLGVLHTPKRVMYGFNLSAGADNDAFVKFDQKAYLSMLVKITYMGVKWVTLPDVVGNAKETLRLFYHWQPVVSGYRIPCAMVAQDGLEEIDIPWSLFDCVFIGGTTDFKYSQAVIDVILEAKKRGKLVHIGRVNTVERIRYFFQYQPDSFDGSGYSRYTERIVRDLITVLDLKLSKGKIHV